MATRKQTTAAKAKQEAQAQAEATAAAETTEAKDASVPEAATPVEAVAPNAEPEATPQPTEIPGDVIAGDGTGNTLPPIEETPGVFVRTKRRIKSRRRAGHRFNREGTGIALELLSEEQLKQLREDPALEVEFCTFPVDQATTTPEA
ncbi:hypothetical protein [Vreelandella maris]|uniref:Mu-like prophage FluMu N-terminal domain-containing protein n=1 Tax=Vreelandella maris TaxID=2729617 RepID=A0A7Y6RDU5_9GAMM|nr:hypothetical protein [Halomonas maris]NVF15006.1 hypothetical protein [Halomonas maris]